MINLELNSKIRLSIPLLAIVGAYVAVRFLKDKGTNIPVIDDLTDKVKTFIESNPLISKSEKTDGVHAAIALALAESGLIDESELSSHGASMTIKPRTQVQSAWSSKIQTLRRNPGQD